MTLDPSRYDGELNDNNTLYNLLYYEEEGARAQTELVPLNTQRADNPNQEEIRPESGYFFAQNDFSGGAGQEEFHGPGSVDNAYWFSSNLVSDRRGHLEIAPDLVQKDTGTFSGAVATANATLFWGDNSTTGHVAKTTDLSTIGDEDTGSANTVLSLAADGAVLYSAQGSGQVRTRSSSGTWSSYVSTGSAANHVAFLKERLIVVGGTNARTIYEIDASGPTANELETIGEGWVFTRPFEIGAFIYVCAVNANAGTSRIHHYGLTSDGIALEKKGSTAMPLEEFADAGIGYLGNLGIILGRRREPGTTSYKSILYTALPDATGQLTLVKSAETIRETTSNLAAAPNGITARGDSVHFAWTEEGDTNVVSSYNPATGGFFPDAPLVPANAAIGLHVFLGRLIVLTASSLYAEDPASISNTGYMITSAATFGMAGKKAWDWFETTFDPLAASEAILPTVKTSHPSSGVFLLLSSEGVAEGATVRRSYPTDSLIANRLWVQFEFTDGSNTTPTLTGYTARALPALDTPDVEWRFNRYIRIFEGDSKGDNPPDNSTSGPWGGDARARRKALHDLAYKRVTLTEPDATWSVRIVGIADFEPMQPLPSTLTDADEAYVVSMTFEGRRTA